MNNVAESQLLLRSPPLGKKPKNEAGKTIGLTDDALNYSPITVSKKTGMDQRQFSQEFLDGYEAWLDNNTTIKHQIQPGAYSVIKRWVESKEDKVLHGCTFRYIVKYMEEPGGFAPGDLPRLRVAFADFGYTLADINKLLDVHKTSLDVAQEILARGVDDSD